MSILKNFKTLKNLSSKKVKRIISLILMVTLGSSSAITVSALSKDVTIKDGAEVTKLRTLHSETDAILKQTGINVNENDKIIRTDFNAKQVDIDIKRAFSVRVFFDGTWHSFTANDGSVANLLSQNNIPHSDDFFVSADLNTPLVPGMEITVSKKVLVNIAVDGRNESIFVPEGSVANAFDFLKISLSADDFVNEPLDRPVENGLNIVVNRVEFKEITENEPIPFATEEKKSDSLNCGDSKIEVKGAEGEKEVTKRVKYINGTPAEAEILAENIITNPVNRVKIVGTKPRPKVSANVKVSEEDGTITDENGTAYRYNKVLTGVCTAYTERPGARTSTGAIARRGLVAVNPKQIPYGTKLYIPGYGICTAADTGGAMRQGRAMIDLYMDSERECRQFGRRTKQVYVLA